MVLILYTHTDMKDIWPITFDKLQKYMPEYKKYIFVNNDSDSIPSDYVKVFYDENLSYTERVSHCIDSVSEETILYFHEDMILCDVPKKELLKKYENYILEGSINSIKLVYSTPNDKFTKSNIDDTLVTGDFSKFSIQPTILKKTLFKEIFKDKKYTIWEFETNTNYDELHFMVKIGGEKKRGIYHYDSLVFPFICTAINKGKWNMTEYHEELNHIFEEYNINPFDRGIW